MKLDLQQILERIERSDYDEFQDLIELSETYQLRDIQDVLNSLLKAWTNNSITLAILHVQLKFIHTYLTQKSSSLTYANQIAFPIGYFSSFLRLNASFLHSFLTCRKIKVQLFQLNRGHGDLKQYVLSHKPKCALFTLSQFHYADQLKKILPFLHENEVQVFLGGKIFQYDSELKLLFPKCKFPNDLFELIDILKQFMGGT